MVARQIEHLGYSPAWFYSRHVYVNGELQQNITDKYDEDNRQYEGSDMRG